MTLVQGNTNDGGAGTGSDGHRVIVNYSYSQNVPGNYTDVTYQYGVDYGDPDYWNNISNRSFTWSVNVGSSVADVSGGGISESNAAFINTSNPGYGGQVHYFGGNWSGVVRIYHNSNGQGTIHLAASMDFGSGYTSSISTNIALPDIVQAPTAPGTPTATRINDGQINLSWTNNSASHHEYASQEVYRSTNGGAYALIATPGAGASSYSDTTTSANKKYTYKVKAINAASSAESAASSAVYTTPGTPAIGTATKLGSGNIQLTWTNNVAYGDANYGTDIYESQDGGTFTYLTSVSAGVSSWEHVSPNPAVTHAYKVLATRGALFSTLSAASNTVVLTSTAAAPTALVASQQDYTSGSARDASDDITFTWTHNPTDGTPQSKYNFRHSIDGGSNWTTVGETASATSSYTLAGGTRSNGGSTTLTFQVATAGENGTVGDWSASSTIQLRSRPTVTATAVAPDPYTDSALTPEWTYAQAEALAQATYVLTLYDSDDNVLEQIPGTGTDLSRALTTALENGRSYSFGVTVTSSVGMTSEEDIDEFEVVFLVPALGHVSAAFDSNSGAMILTITGDDADGVLTDDIDSVTVERSIDGGAYVTVATGIVLEDVGGTLTAILLDTKCAIIGTNTYRVTTYAASGTANPNNSDLEDNDPTTISLVTGWVFVSAGPADGFAIILRMRWNGAYSQDTDAAKALYHFAGRSKPVALAGSALANKVSVSAVLTSDSSTEAEVHALAAGNSVVCYRDPFGRRLFGVLSNVKTSRSDIRKANASFEVTEVDYSE
jgi:hypothetical protein